MAETRSDAEEQGAWARPVSMRAGETVMALALLASAMFFVGLAALLPFGSVELPGPGFFPFALGSALGVLSLVILFLMRRKMDQGGETFLGHRNVLVAIASLVVVALSFEHADTYLPLGAFTAVLLILVARAALWRALLGASLGMVAVWAVFNQALGVRLPTAFACQPANSGRSSPLHFPRLRSRGARCPHSTT
jgi:hypothetical protein